MGSTRALLGSVIVLGLAGLTACSAGNQADADSDGNGGNGDGNGGSMGPGFEVGGGGDGPGQACTDPDCVGNNEQGNCDSALTIEGTSAMDGARAIGLCKEFVEGEWGVREARWVESDGVTELTGIFLDGKGILPDFGPNAPREGSKLLALSSGSARDPMDAGYVDPGGYEKDPDFAHSPPPGYPKESPACPQVITGDPFDSAGLRLVIKTPKDAKSLSFNLNFYTYEYPDFVCSTYNDFFVAMMSPTPAGLPDGNISFDTMGNTISVNAGFLTHCTPTNAGPSQTYFPCAGGYGPIMGTGFDSNTNNCAGTPLEECVFNPPPPIAGSAATGWLETKAPIDTPGSDITLHFAIWDSGDAVLDSTVLVDNFKFELTTTNTGTLPVPE